jgi:radical SAM-linked protein
MWERALRRAELPLAYSGGFSPRPQLSFGLALPTGCESLAEYLDVVLDEDRARSAGIVVETLPALLTGLLPEGIEVEEAVLVPRGTDSLQQLVTSCSWVIGIAGVSRADLEHRVDRLLRSTSAPIMRERKGREELDDLRPSIISLRVHEPEEPAINAAVSTSVSLVAELATQPRGVRPRELVLALAGVGEPEAEQENSGTAGAPVLDRACRTQQWIERDRVRSEPIGLGWDAVTGDRAAHALGRAS